MNQAQTSVIPTHEAQVIDVQAVLVESNETQLIAIAAEFKANQRVIESQETSVLLKKLEQGQLLKHAQALMNPDLFLEWAMEKCGVKSSTVYNYITLASNPELVEWAVQSIGQVAPTHLIALQTASPELQEAVKSRFDSGEKVSVAEINRLKEREKELVAEKLELETNIGKHIAAGVAEKLKKAKSALEKKAIEQVSADFQAKIDAQTDKISELRNKLTMTQRSPNSDGQEQLDELKAQIDTAHRRLQAINEEEKLAQWHSAVRQMTTHLLEQSAMQKASLIALGECPAFCVEQISVELLLAAAHELDSLSALLRKLAQTEQVDRED